MISWLPVICCTPIIAIKARMTRIFSCCISQHKRLVNYCQLFHPHLLHLLLLILILLLLIVHPFNICRGINSQSSFVNTSFNPFRYFFYDFFFLIQINLAWILNCWNKNVRLFRNSLIPHRCVYVYSVCVCVCTHIAVYSKPIGCFFFFLFYFLFLPGG